MHDDLGHATDPVRKGVRRADLQPRPNACLDGAGFGVQVRAMEIRLERSDHRKRDRTRVANPAAPVIGWSPLRSR